MLKTKVLHLTYDMRIGGTEMVIKNIIEGTDSDLFDMSIFCIEAPVGPWGQEMEKKGIKVTTFERQPGFDISLIRAIRKHLKTNQIDIIHCHQYTPWVYGALSSCGLSTRVVFTEHGRFYPDSSSWKRKLINPLLVKMTDAITTISKATRQALVDYEYIPERMVQVVYNGIQALKAEPEEVQRIKTELGLQDNAVVLGTIARLDPIKNQKMMLKAFMQVHRRLHNVYLLVVGDGDMRSELEALVSELKLSDKVIFTGYIASPANYLAAMDLFLLSSLSEGTSMTLLEAMSMGKPCVVTDAGGNPEIIHHEKNGLVSENDNESSFAEKISELLESQELYERMSVSAQELFKSEFERRVMLDKYHLLYRNIMS